MKKFLLGTVGLVALGMDPQTRYHRYLSAVRHLEGLTYGKGNKQRYHLPFKISAEMDELKKALNLSAEQLKYLDAEASLLGWDVQALKEQSQRRPN